MVSKMRYSVLTARMLMHHRSNFEPTFQKENLVMAVLIFKL